MDIGGVALGWGAAELSAMIKKRLKKRKQNTKIAEGFEYAFSRCDSRILVLCNHRDEFREQIFSLAEGAIIRGKTLLAEAKAHAGGDEDSPFAPSILCEHLENFSHQLCELYRQKMSQKYGDLPAGYACLYNELMHRCTNMPAGPGPQPDPTSQNSPFYVPHRQNLLLRHYRSWLEQIEGALGTGQAVINQANYSRDVALHGQGGLGKTAMAVAYAYEYQDRYPGGVFWVQADLGLGQALAELATNLGWPLPSEATDQQIIAAVLPRLRTPEPKLVVLDNLNDKVAPKEIVTLPQSQLLVTTRLSEVSVGKPVTMGLPTEEEALGIFLAYAELEGKDLSEAQQEAAYAVCRRAGFLPVALEILGKNARKVPLVDLAKALDQAVSKKSTVGTKGQELTIAAALAVTSHNYTHPHAKEALLHLTYFYPEELDRELLALVVEVEPAEAQAMLAALAEFSVVQPKPEGGYAMHRLVQEAARLEDKRQKAGVRVVDVLDASIRAVSKAGNYQAGYPLIPHLTNMLEFSCSESHVDSFPRAHTLSRWAFFLYYSGQREASGKMHRMAIARVKASKGTEHQDYAININNLAGVLEAQGKFLEAEKLFQQAIEIDQKTISKKHPNYATHLNNLARVLEEQGKFPEAEKLFRQAIEIDQKTIGKKQPNHAIRLNNLAGVLRAQGKFSEAEELYRQAMEIDQKTIGKEHPSYAIRLNNLAVVLGAQGKFP
ncbi:MAG: tetratricopeptide repeat protein, partial [Proteobacteria bacterium]|nr:tetratricopeptide repeat protein [Pseudomonadota bacterium]